MSVLTDLADDFLDLLACLNEADVRYVLVGEYALNFHGVVRATEDLDVFVDPETSNLRRLLVAMGDFGLPSGLTMEALAPGPVPPSGFRFGRVPISVDILTSIAGLGFPDAWADRVEFTVEGLCILVIGREALLQNKRAARRLKDLADVEALDDLL